MPPKQIKWQVTLTPQQHQFFQDTPVKNFSGLVKELLRAHFAERGAIFPPDQEHGLRMDSVAMDYSFAKAELMMRVVSSVAPHLPMELQAVAETAEGEIMAIIQTLIRKGEAKTMFKLAYEAREILRGQGIEALADWFGIPLIIKDIQTVNDEPLTLVMGWAIKSADDE